MPEQGGDNGFVKEEMYLDAQQRCDAVTVGPVGAGCGFELCDVIEEDVKVC